MNQTVSINYGEILTSNFTRAVNELEEEYGFGGACLVHGCSK